MDPQSQRCGQQGSSIFNIVHLHVIQACLIKSFFLGNLWANDDNKFGHKLMEKMGWEKGKGLGANQVNSL